MAKLSWLKSALVAIAGLMALGMAVPAHAGTISVELDIDGYYKNGSTLGSWTEKLIAELSSTTTTVVQNGITYDVYDITSISGVRKGNTVVGPDDTGSLTTTDALYYDPISKTWAIDVYGFAVRDTVKDILYTVQFLEDQFFVGSTLYSYDYTETGDSGQTAGLEITITQVPAPTALFLIGTSLLGLGVVRRRRNAA